ncbi:efflux RND transporter periplasmic adaptor subunit [Candidatus Parcubacteria bacterium]|nr:efflux RND transporter periplasmic adaptor subunit [Candidatus Parcubacteria bacterium]
MDIPNIIKRKGKIKKLLKKPIITIAITVILVTATVVSGMNLLKNNNNEDEAPTPIKEVQTVKLDLNNSYSVPITGVGTVKADTRVDVVALSNGTVRNVLFEVGDKIFANQTLATLSDNLVLTNLINAETNYANLQNNLLTTQRLTKETIRQAELGVQAAKETVAAAEIGLKTTKDNLNNYLALQLKTNTDAKANAVINYGGHLNTIFNALDQIDSVVKADDAKLNPESLHVDPCLGAKNVSSLSQARGTYRIAKDAYESLLLNTVIADTVNTDMQNTVSALGQTKAALDSTIFLLDNSVTNTVITEAWLSAQKTGFIALRTGVVGAQSAAEFTLQQLQNLTLINDLDQITLENAISAAENQLLTANIGYQNSLVALENTKQGADQQENGAQIALHSALSQLNLARVQAGDLTISSPIAGTVTNKSVELGQKLSPGMKIAEVSQTALLKIEIDIPSDEINKITYGQLANFKYGDLDLVGTVTKIFPVADKISKKVRVEISFNNENNELIPGSFVNVSIPVEQLASTSLPLYIPLKALTIAANEKYVFVVSNNQAIKRTVEIGKTEGTQIEIIKGLSNGDEIIVEGNKNIEDEEKIIIIK